MRGVAGVGHICVVERGRRVVRVVDVTVGPVDGDEGGLATMLVEALVVRAVGQPRTAHGHGSAAAAGVGQRPRAEEQG